MGVIMILCFVPVLVIIFLSLNPIITSSPVGTKSADKDKISSYECGFTPVLGQVRAPITISFYLVGILYLVFDLEIALLIPIVVGLSSIGIISYVAALAFIAILTAGFVFELGSGALNWSNH